MKIGFLSTLVETRGAKKLLLFALALLLAVLGALALLFVVLGSPARELAWEPAAPAPLVRFEAQGAAVDGKLYVFGGYYNHEIQATTRSDAYDPATDTWERVADMPEALSHSPVAVDGETIYFVGGFAGDHPGPSTDRVWKYDTATGAWSEGPPLPEPRGAGAAAVVGRELHFYGGSVREAGVNQYVDFPDHWVLPLDGGTSWEERAPMPNPRNHMSGVQLDGRLYAIGGQRGEDEGNSNQSEVDVYNPATNIWTQVADLPEARGHAAVFVLDGRIVAAGGSVNDGGFGKAVADVTSYDPNADEWERWTPLPTAHKSPIVDAVGSRIVASTGNPGGATPTTTTWTAAATDGS